MGAEAFKVQNVLNAGSLEEIRMLSLCPSALGQPQNAHGRDSAAAGRVFAGNGLYCHGATGILLLMDGLFFNAMDYNLSGIWPLVGLGLDKLLINCDTGCCI